MSENDLWKTIRSGLRGRAHLCRVESHATAVGYPDVDYCIDGVENKLELKYAEQPQAPEVKPSQVLWFTQRIAHGGHPLILARLDGRAGTVYCLYPGSAIARLAKTRDHNAWVKLAEITMSDAVCWNTLMAVMRDPVAIY